MYHVNWIVITISHVLDWLMIRLLFTCHLNYIKHFRIQLRLISQQKYRIHVENKCVKRTLRNLFIRNCLKSRKYWLKLPFILYHHASPVLMNFNSFVQKSAFHINCDWFLNRFIEWKTVEFYFWFCSNTSSKSTCKRWGKSQHFMKSS